MGFRAKEWNTSKEEGKGERKKEEGKWIAVEIFSSKGKSVSKKKHNGGS